MEKKSMQSEKYSFETFALAVTRATGSTVAFITAFILVLLWAAAGPLFHYSGTWQWIINTGTTAITFLMVFLNSKSTKQKFTCPTIET